MRTIALAAAGAQLAESVAAPDAAHLSPAGMALRAAIVYLLMIALFRWGERRLISQKSPFDLVLAIMVGSVASRAITGNAPMVPALAAAAALVALHWVLSSLAFHSHAIGKLVKGDPRVLVRDGEVLWRQMAKSHVTERELERELRGAGIARLEDAGLALLERDGSVTVIGRRTLEEVGPAAATPVQSSGQARK